MYKIICLEYGVQGPYTYRLVKITPRWFGLGSTRVVLGEFDSQDEALKKMREDIARPIVTEVQDYNSKGIKVVESWL